MLLLLLLRLQVLAEDANNIVLDCRSFEDLE